MLDAARVSPGTPNGGEAPKGLSILITPERKNYSREFSIPWRVTLEC